MSHYPPIVAALVTLLLTLFLTLNKDGTIKDIPNERSLHSEPVPRVGGLGIMAGVMAGWLFMLHDLYWWIVLPTLGLFAMSIVDDMRGLTPKTRFIGHVIAAIMLLSGVGLAWYWWIPVLLFIVWMTNLYNFMDGSDGLAGGMAMFGFTLYGFAALKSGIAGGEAFAMMCFSIGAAALGFLYYNFYPAKVFMGDAGSIPLGFLAASFGVWGWQQGYWPIWFPVLVFSPFVMDATATLLQRLRRGENLAQAHRSHYYQRLILSGWGHKNTAIAEYLLMFFVGVTAVWGISQDLSVQANLLAWWAGIYLAASMWVDKRWKRFQAQQESDHAE
jgi:UDP-N-acetylmuramyl pentapeptide phosphotransferase/UDP-N-acetylglucosamine-1-phosphate transferase